jgi:hypothetical protein
MQTEEYGAQTRRSGGVAIDDSVFLAVVLSWVAALIHVVAAFDHAGESISHAIFFVLLALAQLAWGIVVYRNGGGAAILTVGAVGSVMVVVLWIVSRTSGLPFGPEQWEPEPVGINDVLASGNELILALIVACHFGASRGSALARRAGAGAAAAGIFLIVLGAAAALTVGGGHTH